MKVLVVAMLLGAAAGCAPDESGDASPTVVADAPSSPATQDPTPAQDAGPHALEITQAYGPGASGALYVEGAVAEVLVMGRDGFQRMETGSPGSPLTVSGLPPGTYTVRPGLRPCQANCGNLGARTDACETTVEVPGVRRLTVDYRVGEPCTVASS